MIKKYISTVLVFCILTLTVFCTGCSSTKNSIKIFDAKGNELIVVNAISDDFSELENKENRAYIEAVITEALELISKAQKISIKEARKYLLKNNCQIHTAFDNDIYNAINSGYQDLNNDKLSYGCAITDLNGNIIALYSSNSNKNTYTNYATTKTPPYSSFKPLSVYTPAIEKSIINWSSVYLDSPVKKISDGDNKTVDWPKNSTGTYSKDNETIAYSIKTSLNTVAVKCLQDVGVKDSLSFMEDKFGLVLDFEKSKAYKQGEDEVIGNIALGYLNEVISPNDMAGYYQIFANGGKYTQPHTILKITNNIGATIYEYSSNEEQVIEPSTAYIMNKLLQNTTSPGGTADEAIVEGVSVGGKTGTGDNGNWFVGFTPEYTCAIWHGKEIDGNNSCKIFSTTVSKFTHDTNKNFPYCSEIKKAVYCPESGMLFSRNCYKTEMGYYVLENTPKTCNIHK